MISMIEIKNNFLDSKFLDSLNKTINTFIPSNYFEYEWKSLLLELTRESAYEHYILEKLNTLLRLANPPYRFKIEEI